MRQRIRNMKKAGNTTGLDKDAESSISHSPVNRQDNLSGWFTP